MAEAAKAQSPRLDHGPIRAMSTALRGTICRRRELWPELIFTRPELQYPPRLNCVVAFLDRWVEEGPRRRALHLGPEVSYTSANCSNW